MAREMVFKALANWLGMASSALLLCSDQLAGFERCDQKKLLHTGAVCKPADGPKRLFGKLARSGDASCQGLAAQVARNGRRNGLELEVWRPGGRRIAFQKVRADKQPETGHKTWLLFKQQSVKLHEKVQKLLLPEYLTRVRKNTRV